MLHTIDSKLQNEIQRKYQNLDKKLKKLIQSQTIHPQQKHEFYPRVINNTKISFTQCEMTLLQKGLKYNLHTMRENWIQNLALEAETALQKLPSSDREIYTHKVTDRINTLQRNSNTQSNPNSAIHEAKTMRSIQSKFRNNDETITRADKGNFTVILPKKQYNNKLQEFIQNNKFDTAHTDPHKNFSVTNKKHSKQQHRSHPERNKMEIHKHESVSTHHKRPHKGSQTQSAH